MSIEIFSSGSYEEFQTVLDNKLFRGMLDTMRNGILVLKSSRDGRKKIVDFIYVFANKAAENFTGEDIVGKKLSFRPLSEHHSFFERLIKVVNTGTTEDLIYPVIFYEKEVWYHCTLQKFGDGVMVMYEDITERKNSEEKIATQHCILKEAEEKINQLNNKLLLKNRELESINSELRTFTSVVATDYKETLKHLYTLFEFIITADARNLSNGGKANLRRAQSAIQKMKLLTDDILAYSAIQTARYNIETTDVNEIFKTVLEKLENKIADTSAEIKLENKLPKIQAFPELLFLLFYHLLDNAIKFRKDEFHPVVKLQSSSVSGMLINCADADPAIFYTLISISDNGIGIETVQKEKMFEMFYKAHDKTKYRGSGIGLAICKKIMKIHGGFITAESTPENSGAIFNCFFPLQAAHLSDH